MKMRHRLPTKPALVTLALATLTSGCAVSPLVTWTAPPKPGDGSITMGYAMSYASAARDAYRKRMHDHVEQQGLLSGALLGIGVLATGAAAARMHRDAYAGLAFAGGSSYAFGQQTLRPERLSVYVAGVEAMNCAIAVVMPLNLDTTKAKALRDEAVLLNEALSRQDAAMAKLRAAIAPMSESLQVASWKEQLAASATLRTSAKASANAAVEMDGKVSQGAGALVVAVDRVQLQVEKAALATLPSLDAVFQPINSLPRYAGLLLPGAKLDERIGNAIASSATAAGKAQAAVAGVAVTEDVRMALQAHDDLVLANQALAGAAARVNGLLAGLDATTSTAGLSECKVAGVVTPLSVSKSELRFAGSKEEMQSFTVKGGVSPYRGTLTSSVAGVTVGKAADNDRRFEVRVAASVTSASLELQVTDSANGETNSAEVAIQVGTAPPAGPSTPPAGAPSAAPTLDSFATAIGQVMPFKTANGHSYSFVNNVPADSSLTTQLKCSPSSVATAKKDSEAEVRTALVKAAGQQTAYTDVFKDGKTLRVTATPAGCMKPES
jgi:hypothetical protein